MKIKKHFDQIGKSPAVAKLAIIALIFTWAILWAAFATGMISFSFETPGRALVATPGTTIPAITLDPASGPLGTYITVHGQGWQPGSMVLIYLTSPEETSLPTYAMAGSVVHAEGQFTTGFPLPADSRWQDQEQFLIIAKTKEGGTGAQANFLVLQEEVPTATPTATAEVVIIPTEPVESTATPTAEVPTATPTSELQTATPTPEPALPVLTSLTDLNIRGGPGTGYPILGVLRTGQSAGITAVSTDGGWWQIEFSGAADKRGWVSARYVNAQNTNNIPVAQAPALPPQPQPPPVPPIVDWRGEYYNNRDLAGAPVLVRNDVGIDFNWGISAPAPGLPPDNFSVRWTRTLPFAAGLYRFHAWVDDGLRLYVDDTLVIDDWRDSEPREITGERWLSSGNHKLRVEYYERTIDAVVRVWWARVDYPGSYPDWKGEYWSNRSLSGRPALVRNDVVIDFDWHYGSPAAGLPVDNFSARWSRDWHFREGLYRFHATIDDGLRVYVDGSLVIDDWRDGGRREVSGERWLSGGNHSLRVDYYEYQGQARIVVWVERISDAEPEADFDAHPRRGPVPLKVEFDNESDGDYDECKWEFGDGDTSRDCDDRRHTYHQAGKYTVRLKVSGSGGSDSTKKEDYITVRPVAEFTASPRDGTQPLTVDFVNLSTAHDICEWDFGDGGTSTLDNPSHSYQQAGVYTVRLRVKEAGVWSDLETKAGYISVTGAGPTVKFVANPLGGAAPLDVAFTNHTLGSDIEWLWNFGDGTTSTEKDPVHTYITPGNYTVSLTAKGPGGTGKVTRPNYISVTGAGPTVKFVANPLGGSAPLEVAFTNHTLGTGIEWEWGFGDGTTSTEKDPVHTYITPGNYTVSLTATGPDGTNTLTRPNYISVTGAGPTVKFVANPLGGAAPLDVAFTNHTLGTGIEWQWDFGDGTTSTEKDPVHTYITPGNYTVSLTAKGPGGTDKVTRPNYISVTESPTTEPVPATEPTVEPTIEPTVEPATEPTVEPATEPIVEPTAEPTVEPATEPTVEPATEPTVEPATEPTVEPATEPTVEPATEPTVEPASEPTAEPTSQPVAEPSTEPTSEPVVEPITEPTVEPTTEPMPD